VTRSLKKFHSGVKRLNVQEKVAGISLVVEEGKDPLPFQCYSQIAKVFLERDQIFEHTYLTLSWNLICRTNNVSGIRLDYMRWYEDNVGVFFAVTKNDQEGDLKQSKRPPNKRNSRFQVLPKMVSL